MHERETHPWIYQYKLEVLTYFKLTAQRLDGGGPTHPYHPRNEESFTRASASPRPRQYYQNPSLFQQGSLLNQRPAVVPPVAASRASAPQIKSSCAEATPSAVDSWPLNGLTTAQAASDDPTDDRSDQIIRLSTNDNTRECEESPHPSVSRGISNTQPRLSDPSPSQGTSQLAPRQEDHRTGAPRKRKRSQFQDPSTATNGLDSVVGIDAGSDVLVP